MSRCSNNALLAKIGQKKLDSNKEIDFSVRRPLPDCRKVNARKAINAVLPFRKMLKPVNRFECAPDGCSTTGTATVATTAQYFISGDATEFSSGVITFYVKADTLPMTVKVRLSDTEAMTDADVYNINLTANMKTDDDFIPVMVKLSDPADGQDGNGWTASANGVYIEFSGDDGAGTAVEFGLSTIGAFNSVLDFRTNSTVKMACISSAGGSYDLSVIEQTCRKAELDDSISQLSFPITARLMTPNFYLLNPMYEEGTETEGFRLVTVEKTVEEYTVDGKRYGRVAFSDAHQECRFWGVQLADSCSPFEAQMEELTIPVLTEVEEGYFQILRNADGVAVIFNEALIGTKVLIEYPQVADIKEFIMSTDSLNEVSTSMTVPYCFDGGVEELHIYDNVLVTGFPFGLSNQDQEVSFTITITKVDGKFFRIQRYV